MSADPKTLVEALRRLVKAPVSFMEVCGTHTVSIFRSGIRSLLPDTLRLVSGPGCPVCVTDQGEIEAALSLLERGVTRDLRRYVQGPSAAGSLSSMAGKGHDARIVTSTMDALHRRGCSDRGGVPRRGLRDRSGHGGCRAGGPSNRCAELPCLSFRKRTSGPPCPRRGPRARSLRLSSPGPRLRHPRP